MKLTLRTKILLSSILPLLAIVLLLAGVLIVALYNARLDSTWRLMTSSVRFTANQLDADNARAGDTAASIALAQANGLFGDRARSLEFTRDLLESTPGITGVFLAYADDADVAAEPGGAKRSAPARPPSPNALSPDGRFVPYWSRDKNNSASIRLQPHAHLGDVLGGAARDGSALRRMAEPEFRDGRLIVEQASPIVINGQFKGVAGVARSVEEIGAWLGKHSALTSAEFILVSQGGRIIAASGNPALSGRRIEETPHAAVIGRLYRDGEIDEPTTLEDPVTGESRLYAGTSIATGNWRLLLSVSQQEIVGPVRHRGVQILFLFIGGVLLSMVLSMLMLRRIVQRVEQAADAVARVAEGDLAQEVDSSASDESGQMLRAIGNMVQSLQALISRLKISNLQLVSSATDISAAVQRQRDASNDFGASTNQIAASTNEITATSRELLETMNQVVRASADTAEVANRGRSDLERMEAIMQHLSAATASISSKLSVISERANKIGSVVTTINRVAEQTNLLSLNASIEAEKAGEYGLGFSVVAREIRRLADQTAVATLGIERIVSEMQGSVTSGVMEMDRFDEQVRAGVREAIGLGEQMAVIIEGVENLRPRFEMAQQSMQAQVSGAGQINDAMTRLRENAMSSSVSSDGLQAAAEQLLSAVELLRTELARFKTVNQ